MPPKTQPRILKQVIGMNSYEDSVTLPDGVVKLIQNMVPRKTSLETREGWARHNIAVACTADNATETFTATSHGLVDTDRVYISATTLPTGISATTCYYVVNKTTHTFQVSLTSGGAAVTFTTNGTGVYFSKGLTGSAGIFGLGYYAATSAIDLVLAVSNGKLYSGNAGTFTERYDGLSTTTLCSIVQFDDKALIVDQVNKMRVYKYGETTYTAGIDSPKEFRLIEDFEAATDWSTGNGGTANNTVNFIYGTQCITFLTTAGLVMTASKTISAKNLTTFPDGSTSATNDYISLFLIRGVYANFDSLVLDLGDANFANYYTITISNLAEWLATSAPDVGFELKMRKSLFTTGAGAPNWNSITAVRFTIDAAAGLQAQIIVDYLRLEKAGPTTTVPCTAANATNTFTSTAHGLIDTDRISFNAVTMPTGLVAQTIYFIVTAAANTFQVSATSGGAAITFTTDGSGIVWIKGAPGVPDNPCTADAATDIFTAATHGLVNGNEISFAASTMPTGLAVSTTYYVITATTNTFQVSATLNGTAVNFTTNGAGVKWMKGVTGSPCGTYHYRVTFVTQDGWESDPSVASDPVSVTDQQITLTNIPVPGSSRIASKKIYRIGGMSAEWRLLTILYDRTTTTWIDTIADENLGDFQEIVEGQPYIPKCITVHSRSVVIANLTSTDGTTYPCGVMVSNEDSVDIFDHDYFFEIEPSIGGKINWIMSAMDFVYVGKSNGIWKFDPEDLSIPPRNLSRIFGGVGPLAVAAGDNEFYFLDLSGVVSFNGSFFDVISDPSPTRVSSVQNYIKLIPSAYTHTCWMKYYDKTLFVGIPQTGDTSPSLILAFYIPKQIWYVISGWAVRCALSEKIAGIDQFYLGHVTIGYVYKGFSGDTDGGSDITSIIQTSDWDFGAPEVRKDYAKCFLFGKKLTSTSATLTVEPYIDVADSALDISLSVDSTTYKKFEIPMPALGGQGIFLGLKITATERWSFQALIERARLWGPTI